MIKIIKGWDRNQIMYLHRNSVSDSRPTEKTRYVGETSIDDFGTYEDQCAEKGFSVDYEKGDRYYTADDAAGNSLSLTYVGNNVMTIELNKASETHATDIEYADYVAKYAQAMKDFEAWESKNLNATEAAYYLDVQTRINQKLAKFIQ